MGMQRIKIISKKVQHCRRTLSDFNTYYKGILIKIVLFYYKHVLVCEMSILVYLSLSIYIYTHTHTHTIIYIYTYMYMFLSEKAMAPTPVRLPGKSHGWRSLVGCGPRGH